MRKGIYLLPFLAMMLLAMMFTQEAYAESKQIYKVGADDLNVRNAPSKEAEVVGQLNQGDQVAVFQEKYGWLQTYYNGQAVWVASHYLYKVNELSTNTKNEQVQQAVEKIKITANGVHIRKGPSTNHTILEVASKGDTYRFIETNNDWHKIKLDNNSTAWVASWLTNNPTTTETPTTSKSKAAPPQKTVSTNVQGNSLNGYNIMLDASHGGKDPGAISMNGEYEKDFALQVTNTVAERLRSVGANVILTRPNDTFISLADRVRLSDDYWTHAFISLHFNAALSSAGNGISTHYYSNGEDKQLAHSIQQALNKHTSLKDRGVRQNDYYVLRENNAVSVLTELGFITNSHDLQTIQDSQYANQVADAIAEGLNNYFQ